MIYYALARFQWFGVPCEATLEPDGWKVPRFPGMESALNHAVGSSPNSGQPECRRIEAAVDAVRRLFPGATIQILCPELDLDEEEVSTSEVRLASATAPFG